MRRNNACPASNGPAGGLPVVDMPGCRADGGVFQHPGRAPDSAGGQRGTAPLHGRLVRHRPYPDVPNATPNAVETYTLRGGASRPPSAIARGVRPAAQDDAPGHRPSRTGNAMWGMQFVWPIKAEYVIVQVEPTTDCRPQRARLCLGHGPHPPHPGPRLPAPPASACGELGTTWASCGACHSRNARKERPPGDETRRARLYGRPRSGTPGWERSGSAEGEVALRARAVLLRLLADAVVLRALARLPLTRLASMRLDLPSIGALASSLLALAVRRIGEHAHAQCRGDATTGLRRTKLDRHLAAGLHRAHRGAGLQQLARAGPTCLRLVPAWLASSMARSVMVVSLLMRVAPWIRVEAGSVRRWMFRAC